MLVNVRSHAPTSGDDTDVCMDSPVRPFGAMTEMWSTSPVQPSSAGTEMWSNDPVQPSSAVTETCRGSPVQSSCSDVTRPTRLLTNRLRGDEELCVNTEKESEMCPGRKSPVEKCVSRLIMPNAEQMKQRNCS